MTTETKTTYYDNGQIKQRESDKRDEYWFSNGQLAADHYSNDSGRYRNEWYENGQKKLEYFRHKDCCEIDNKDNFGNQYEYQWYENGQKKMQFSPERNLTYWYQNGQKELEGVQENDSKKSYTETHWYENGTVRELRKMSNDELDFLIETYYSNGKLKSRTTKYLIPPNRSDSWMKYDLRWSWWDKDGNETGNPKPYIQESSGYGGGDVMDGLTDDEKELGRDFWDKTL